MNLAEATIAVVGATGAVGVEMLMLLAEAGVPAERVRAAGSERSTGKRVPYGAGTLALREPESAIFDGCDVALLAVSSDLAKEMAPAAAARGAVVIDNSSAFRMDPAVPLVVPEVNPAALQRLDPRRPIIANPNCTTIITLVGVTPLRRAFGVQRLVIASYQAVSGAGAAAMDELRAQAAGYLAGAEPAPSVFREPCAFNVFSHDSAVDPVSGMNAEELKAVHETRKIWDEPGARVFATCVRVPVFRSHTIAASVELTRPASEAEVRGAIAHGASVRVIDDRAANSFPTARKASGGREVLVGRIRPDPSVSDPDSAGRCRGWGVLIAGDQLLKGAAQNAVQIAQMLPEGSR